MKLMSFLFLFFAFLQMYQEKKQREESERRKQYQAEASAMTDHKGIEDRKIHKELAPLVCSHKHYIACFIRSQRNE